MNPAGFRAPNVHELRSLLWMSDDQEKWYRKAFKDSEDWYWCSSEPVRFSSFAYAVNFQTGVITFGSKLHTYRVRLMRITDQVPFWRPGNNPKTRYRHIAENVILDGFTGYEWQAFPKPGKYTWDEAVKGG